MLALQLLWRSGCAGAELVHFYWARGGIRITFEELEFPGLDLRSVFLIFFCAFLQETIAAFSMFGSSLLAEQFGAVFH